MRISDWSSDVCSSDLAATGIEPGYEQRQFAPDEARGKLRLVGSQDGANGAVTIHQDARMYLTRLDAEETVVHDLDPGRYAWIQVARGAASVDGEPLKAGDGAAVSEQSRIAISGSPTAEEIGRASCRERVCQYV